VIVKSISLDGFALFIKAHGLFKFIAFLELYGCPQGLLLLSVHPHDSDHPEKSNNPHNPGDSGSTGGLSQINCGVTFGIKVE
jgi:hypothetical protein